LPVSVSLPAPATSVSAAAVPVSVSAPVVPSWSTALARKAPLVLPKMT
jgi:predicted MFS family arabinose efflux permease